jgi:hypothetical protein
VLKAARIGEVIWFSLLMLFYTIIIRTSSVFSNSIDRRKPSAHFSGILQFVPYVNLELKKFKKKSSKQSFYHPNKTLMDSISNLKMAERSFVF